MKQVLMAKWKIFISMVLFISCSSMKKARYSKDYCGYLMSSLESSKLIQRMHQDTISYKNDTLWNLYRQINDTLRSAVDDTIVFEIFMTLLNETEIGIEVWAPGGDVSCKILNANYHGKLPSQRYAVLYRYTNKDGSGDLIFVNALKKED